eukprot:Gb_19934 [translate_table: standard]
MFAKRLFHRAVFQVNQSGLPHGNLKSAHLNPRVTVHCGIPSTSSLLSFDPFQRLLAVATLDGRIKVIGGPGIEYLLDSPIQLPCKFLEFLNNRGHVVSISNQNDIQVWDLDGRALACYVKWESNITAFAVLQGTPYMYIGDDLGNVAVVKYDQEEGELSKMPYYIPAHIVQETSNNSVQIFSSVVGIFPQPSLLDTRVLIAYDDGLIILWDLYEAQVVVVRGGTNLQLKNDANVSSPSKMEEETSDNEEAKEICCACWASADGSTLAVGYTDGDILLWSIPSGSNKQKKIGNSSSKIVVKVQLFSGKRRIPVIVLRWSASRNFNSEDGGHLFVYGGDEIGSPEVVTVLCLKWSEGLASLTCISRLDLMLQGSFADMILLPNAGSTSNDPFAALLVLTNPGHLHAYDEASISEFSLSSQEERSPLPPQLVPIQVPLVEPCVTAAKLVILPKDGKASKIFAQLPRDLKTIAPSILSAGTKWPVTGGVFGSALSDKSSSVNSIYITGHENGTVRVWDATVPFLCLLCFIENKIQNISSNRDSAEISALDFCPISEILAVGDKHGLVRLYKLSADSGDVSCHVVSGTGKQVHVLHCESGFQCVAVLDVHQFPICSFAFANAAARVTVGSESGLVSVLDLHSFSILFLRECSSDRSARIISMIMKTVVLTKEHISSPTSPKSGRLREKDSTEALNIVFVLTKDANVLTVDGDTGAFLGSRPLHPKHQSTAVALHLIDASSVTNMGLTGDALTSSSAECGEHACGKNKSENELTESQADPINSQEEEKEHFDNTISISGQSLENSLLLLCSEDALRLYSASSIIEGNNNSIRKVNLGTPCCWASVFKNKDENADGLVLLYQSGLLEMRSLPDMEVIRDISLSSILRWKFQPNWLKTITSAANGRIALIHNNEIAFLSLLANENDFRIPASLPCLHDRDIAAAADAALKAGSHEKKKKNQIQGLLSGVIKEIKGGVLRHASGSPEHRLRPILGLELSSLFAWCPFPGQCAKETSDIGPESLDIDDIEIEEASSDYTSSPHAAVSSGILIDTHKISAEGKGKQSDRQKLLDEKTEELAPRKRTPEEIRAAYGHKKTGDVSGAAGLAMNKLRERGEKLQTINKHTEELQAGAENFASMADELLKTMEGRKWWKI